jgi:methionyl aminopeptidase
MDFPSLAIAFEGRALYHTPPFKTTRLRAFSGSFVSITLKSPEEQNKMRAAGAAAASVLDMIGPQVKAGVATEELDRICHDFIVKELRGIPAPLHYGGTLERPPFPKSICTSVNHVVCHGIPGPKVLKKGDVVNVDVTVIKDGFHGDTSQMFYVGEPSVLAKRLADTTRDAMIEGIRVVRPGARLGDIGHAIQRFVEARGYSIVREYCGHGIGRIFHEDPQVLHYGRPGTGLELHEGMTFTVEPMVNAGRPEVKLLPDGWTVVTKDHSLSAQWEHTVLVTKTGFEVLTLRSGETIS